MHIAAVLRLKQAAPSPEAVLSGLETRLPGIARLRHRLVRLPPGLGPPIWVDAADFNVARQCRSPP